MDKQPDNTPRGWLEDLARADAEIDAGLFLTADEVHRLFDEAKIQRTPQSEARKREATARH